MATIELRALRSQLGRPWGLPAPAPRLLHKDKRRAIVDVVAGILKAGEPTPFAGEGACRHGIRAALALQGWPWESADDTAATILRSALARIGARRPTYEQGQPEWCQPGIILIARSRCVRCDGELPEGHWRFCSDLCRGAHQKTIARRDADEATRAAERAYLAAWRKKLRDAQPVRACACCGRAFQPNRPEHRLCSTTCRNRHNGGLRRG